MRFSWPAALVLVLLAMQPAAAQLRIVLDRPAVADGGTLTHDSQVLPVFGRVEGGLVRQVLVNGQSATQASRDLFIEGLEEHSTSFRATLSLEAGATEVVVEAAGEDGSRTMLRFRVQYEAVAGAAYALVVGVDDYSDPRIADLRYAEADARAVKEALTHPRYGVVPPDNLVLLTGAEATYRNVSRALEEHLVRRATRPEDMVFFYFAGHGAEGAHLSRGAAYYLVPQDAEADNLMSTAIDKGRLQFLWGAVAARRKIFITDACHSGGMQNMKVLSAQGLETVEGFITLAAARADQLSWELPRLGHGIFTYSLTAGLTGGAEKGGDGLVGIQELGAYLRQQVGVLAAEAGAEQNPVIEVAPGAEAVLLATQDGRPLPPWTPPPPSPPPAFSGLLKVNADFGGANARPYIVAALRDEVDGGLADVAQAALVKAFDAQGSAFRFVEPGVMAEAVPADKADWATGDDPARLAAIARAAAAHLIISGSFRVSEASIDEAEMKELLGTSVQSYQAHLNARAVFAHSGEIAQAQTATGTAAHINAEVARRKAVEKAAASLAKKLQRPLFQSWRQHLRQRPNGLLRVDNVDDYRLLEKVEAALVTLAPAIGQPRWHGFEGSTAVFEFTPGGTARQAAAALDQKAPPGFAVGGVKSASKSLTFWLAPAP